MREEGTASVSLLQQRLRLSEDHAVHLLDVMEKRRVVGPGKGSDGERKILIDLGPRLAPVPPPAPTPHPVAIEPAVLSDKDGRSNKFSTIAVPLVAVLSAGSALMITAAAFASGRHNLGIVLASWFIAAPFVIEAYRRLR